MTNNPLKLNITKNFSNPYDSDYNIENKTLSNIDFYKSNSNYQKYNKENNFCKPDKENNDENSISNSSNQINRYSRGIRTKIEINKGCPKIKMYQNNQYYDYVHIYNKENINDINRDSYFIQKINEQNDNILIKDEFGLGVNKRKFGINKMKEQFDQKRKVKSLIKTNSLSAFNNYQIRDIHKKIIDNNIFNSPFNISHYSKSEMNLTNQLSAKNFKSNELNKDENTEYYLDNTNKKSFVIPILQSTTASSLNNKKGGLNQTINKKFITRNFSTNKNYTNNFFKSSNINKLNKENLNENYMTRDDNLYSTNNLFHNSEDFQSTDFNTLNKLLSGHAQNFGENRKYSNKNNGQTFYESPFRKNEIPLDNNDMKNLEILRKLAFKEEPKRFFIDTEDV